MSKVAPQSDDHDDTIEQLTKLLAEAEETTKEAIDECAKALVVIKARSTHAART